MKRVLLLLLLLLLSLLLLLLLFRYCVYCIHLSSLLCLCLSSSWRWRHCAFRLSVSLCLPVYVHAQTGAFPTDFQSTSNFIYKLSALRSWNYKFETKYATAIKLILKITCKSSSGSKQTKLQCYYYTQFLRMLPLPSAVFTCIVALATPLPNGAPR